VQKLSKDLISIQIDLFSHSGKELDIARKASFSISSKAGFSFSPHKQTKPDRKCIAAEKNQGLRVD